MKLAFRPFNILFIFLLVYFSLSLRGLSQEGGTSSSTTNQPDKVSDKLTLRRAAICEGVKDYAPENEAIVFSVAVGKVFCFTYFNPVPEETVIYHSWFYRDRLVTKQKLSLKTPQWATYSSIQLRDSDKGPWRVAITDPANVTLRVLHFSITD